MDKRDWRTYRHRLTGLVKSFHPRVASADSNLVEVPEDAKPLAYTPIPKEAVEKVRKASKSTDEPEKGEE